MGTKVSYPRKGDLCQNPAKSFFRGARRNRLTKSASTNYVSPAAGKISAPRPKKTGFIDRFQDVPKNAWYAGYVGAAYESGIVKGVSETLFQPGTTITDSEAETMVARAAHLMGIEPTTSETWRPSDMQITRGEVAQMLYDLLASAGLM